MRNIFFDLEGVLIESWLDPVILMNIMPLFANADCLVNVINIFSFAIYDDSDRERFNNEIRPRIEDAFGKKVGLVLTRDDIITAVNDKFPGRHIGKYELTDFYDKETAFQAYVRSLHNPGEYVLIDDCVEDTRLIISDGETNTEICTACVDPVNGTVNPRALG